MPFVNHVNIADGKGQVYCCLRNRVVDLTKEHRQTYCGCCKMFNGDADGQGVECLWDDALAAQDEIIARNPYQEWVLQQMKHTILPFSGAASELNTRIG